MYLKVSEQDFGSPLVGMIEGIIIHLQKLVPQMSLEYLLKSGKLQTNDVYFIEQKRGIQFLKTYQA